jgi:hypothetical protein
MVHDENVIDAESILTTEGTGVKVVDTTLAEEINGDSEFDVGDEADEDGGIELGDGVHLTDAEGEPLDEAGTDTDVAELDNPEEFAEITDENDNKEEDA